jgi:hypothetical protein
MDALADHVCTWQNRTCDPQREVETGGIAAWKALRDLLPRDEDIPSGSPSLSFSQLFIAAHKEINRSEQTKPVPPVIDVTAEPVLALAKLTDMRDGAGGGQPSDRLGKTNHAAPTPVIDVTAGPASAEASEEEVDW